MRNISLLFLMIGIISILGISFAAETAVLLEDGTPVILRLTETVSTKTKNTNDIVHFEVTRDVIVNGKVVIKAGTPADGTVNVCTKPDIIGQEGTIGFVLNSTKTVDEQWVSLRASLTRSGQNKEILSAGAGYACCPVFGLIKGTHAEYPEGTEIKAYTENDLKVNIQ